LTPPVELAGNSLFPVLCYANLLAIASRWTRRYLGLQTFGGLDTRGLLELKDSLLIPPQNNRPELVQKLPYRNAD